MARFRVAFLRGGRKRDFNALPSLHKSPSFETLVLLLLFNFCKALLMFHSFGATESRDFDCDTQKTIQVCHISFIDSALRLSEKGREL
jgi:hypothetical protein